VNAPSTSLGDAARHFLRHPTPWILGAWFVAGVVGRVLVDEPWSWWELAVVAGLLAVQPVAEWVIHITILHWRPRQVLGRTVDLRLAREHRVHHQDPKNLEILFVPAQGLVLAAAVTVATAWLVAVNHGHAMTAIATVGAQFTAYEWTHYLIHTDHRPRSRWYRSLWRNHRLHHFRNERYWLGVTSNLGDRLLGTNPARGEVEASPTARDLLGAGHA